MLFAAAVPSQVYFPAGGLQVDRYGSIRSPILLDEGMVYSVVSDVPVTEPTDPAAGRTRRSRSRSIPRTCSSRRTFPRASARWLVGSRPAPTTQYDRVEAVQSWIRANTRYDLDVPRDPVGVDAVDHFLFVTRTGFCEQIATSLAIMLRTLGIQTRLVTGYGPGERNPLTGYFEVRQSDAHAWVEVFYPGIGWVPYDPTFGVPEAAPHASSRFIGGEVLAAVGRFLSSVIPDSVKQLVRDAGSGIGVVWDGLVRAWPVALAVLALLALAIGIRRRRRSQGPAQPAALGAYLDLTEALAPRGSSADRTRHASRVPARRLGGPRHRTGGRDRGGGGRGHARAGPVLRATGARRRPRPGARGRRDRAGARVTTLTPVRRYRFRHVQKHQDAPPAG